MDADDIDRLAVEQQYYGIEADDIHLVTPKRQERREMLSDWINVTLDSLLLLYVKRQTGR